MEKIKSFTINHDILVPGFYISREDGDVITYDLRTRKPNAGDYMDNPTMHSLEHMIATLIRNSDMGNDVVYFGPMGCQTGFYLLVRDIMKTCPLQQRRRKRKNTWQCLRHRPIWNLLIRNKNICLERIRL